MAELTNKQGGSFSHSPTDAFTMKREDFKKLQDLKLVSHFASWLSKLGNKEVTEENFEDDLMDGVALCRVMKKLEGANMGAFHEPKGETMDSFKGKENIVFFQNSTKALKLPITFGTEDLEKRNISRVVSTLVFIAHTAKAQGVGVKEMDQEILDKVQEMDEAIEDKATDLTWWQQLLQKLGLGDWIDSLNLESLKAYIAQLQENIKAKLKGEQAPPKAEE